MAAKVRSMFESVLETVSFWRVPMLYSDSSTVEHSSVATAFKKTNRGCQRYVSEGSIRGTTRQREPRTNIRVQHRLRNRRALSASSTEEAMVIETPLSTNETLQFGAGMARVAGRCNTPSPPELECPHQSKRSRACLVRPSR